MSKKGEVEKEDAVDIVVQAGSAVALQSNAAAMFEQDAGMGLEGADKDSFAIPFITILQPLSPVVVDEIVDGAKAGLFFNTVSQQLAKDIQFVPVAFQRKFLRWSPREKGGGYKGEYSPIDVELDRVEGMMKGDDGRYYIGGTNPKEHDQLKDTRNHFVLVLRPEGGWSPALISLASTQIKRSKRLLSRIQGVQLRGANGQLFTPPSFSHIYSASTEKESNDQGTWYSWVIDVVGPVQDGELYNAAKAFHAQIVAGQVQTAPPVNDVAGGSTEVF